MPSGPLKVVYIPLSIPASKRTMFAMVLTFVASLFVIIAAAQPHWYKGFATIRPPGAAAHVGTTNDTYFLSSITFNMGLERLDMVLCDQRTRSSVVSGEIGTDGMPQAVDSAGGHGDELVTLCVSRDVVFTNCGTHPEDRSFCVNGPLASATFAFAIIAGCVGALSVFGAFFREWILAPGALSAGLSMLIVFIGYAHMLQGLARNKGGIAFTGRYIHNLGVGTFNETHGWCLVLGILAILMYFVATVFAMSVFACRCRGKSASLPPPAPPVVVLEGTEIAGRGGDRPPAPGADTRSRSAMAAAVRARATAGEFTQLRDDDGDDGNAPAAVLVPAPQPPRGPGSSTRRGAGDDDAAFEMS